MQLLVIRHAVAQTREEFAGDDDAQRPLTKEGRRQMRRVATGLRHVVGDLDVLAASPFLRAMQTAEIVAEEFAGVDIATVEALEPESALPAFVTWLRKQREAELVAVVGHEPHLGTLVTWLLTGTEESRTPLKKGGACLLDFPSLPRTRGAMLHWALTPALLRDLARR
ncbi:MAG: phosphohistidine phosphatase SixA [Gemmatimonadaceae bacterium]